MIRTRLRERKTKNTLSNRSYQGYNMRIYFLLVLNIECSTNFDFDRF